MASSQEGRLLDGMSRTLQGSMGQVILKALHGYQDGSTVAICDITLHYHFVRELIINRKFELMYCSTDINVVNGCTQALPREHLIRHKGIGPPLDH